MGTIEVREGKDGKPRFRARVRRDGVHISQTFTRKTDAKKWIRSEESDIDEGRLTYKSEARRRTVAQMADKYIEQVVPRKESKEAPAQMMRWWKSEIGRMKLIQATPTVIADCRDKLLSSNTYRHTPRAPATVVRYLVRPEPLCWKAITVRSILSPAFRFRSIYSATVAYEVAQAVLVALSSTIQLAKSRSTQ